jgi:4-amino-4-deoxy-L-arabinose transferase-like glycosyltransferase
MDGVSCRQVLVDCRGGSPGNRRFDAAGYVTVDKPPLGFWIQATSARLFDLLGLGFSGLAVLLPEALAGVVLLVVSFAWPVIVDLTPAGERPYVGSTQDNSAISRPVAASGLSWDALRTGSARAQWPRNGSPGRDG